MSNSLGSSLNFEKAVCERYSQGATQIQADLCCPTSYDPALLKAIPVEVIERDYGCGDPSKHLREGETVLDLGSGTGKICFIASQVVGSSGRVIGIDMNDDMLVVARRNAPRVADAIGFSNVEFRKGKIQDLSLDLERLDAHLRAHPVHTAHDLEQLKHDTDEWKRTSPLVADQSVDVVMSNCVLNLVNPTEKEQLFAEIFRVLRRGGRAIISDIVSDEDIPQHLAADPELWSGCISGAFREDLFLSAFEEAGFYGITLAERDDLPWRTVEGIEFRSVTVVAYKGKQGPCWDHKQAVVYRGPFRQVEDDDGHLLRRGVRTAVCEKTFTIYSREPYASHFELVPPNVPVSLEAATPFPCGGGTLIRDPKATKGEDYTLTTEAHASCCDPNCGSNGECC